MRPRLSCLERGREWLRSYQADCPSKISSPSGSMTQGCFLRVHMRLVGRSQEVLSNVPPRTRATPSLVSPQIQEPHSGQTSLVFTRPLSAVR
jgi:hypothetical protein